MFENATYFCMKEHTAVHNRAARKLVRRRATRRDVIWVGAGLTLGKSFLELRLNDFGRDRQRQKVRRYALAAGISVLSMFKRDLADVAEGGCIVVEIH